MSNITHNRLNATLTEAQLQTVSQALHSIFEALPFLTGLTTEERIALPKINVNNKVFTQDALLYMQQNAEMLPAFMQQAPMQNDLTLYHQLDPIITRVQQLLEQLEDTQMLAGSEAYVSALSAYRLFGAAAVAGIAGADTVYDALRTRFAAQGSTTPPPPNAPQP